MGGVSNVKVQILKSQTLKESIFSSKEFSRLKTEKEVNFNVQLQVKELEDLAADLQQKFDLLSRYLKIEIDEDLHMPIIKIIDKNTNEVIRQIPPEYFLRIAKNLDQVLGLLINKRV